MTTQEIIRYFILAALLAATSHAASVTLEWQDNSDNETAFVMEGRRADGTWEPVSTHPANVVEASVDTDTHDAWRVYAENEWGKSGYTNVLEKGAVPSDPNGLKLKEKQSKPVTYYEDVRIYQKLVESDWRG